MPFRVGGSEPAVTKAQQKKNLKSSDESKLERKKWYLSSW